MTAPGKETLDVLVVEDNPINQKVAGGLLAKWGHRVEVACDGSVGLEALARRTFDLVLMDIQMPVMDGLAATRAIREGESRRALGEHVLIIAVTAHAGNLDRALCFEAGVDRFITKPIQSSLLRQYIAELFPATAEPGSVPVAPVVDIDQLKEYVGDDPALQAEVVQLFLDDTPAILVQAASAIASGDPAALMNAAHRLKGSLSTMGAAGAADTARRLEAMGREGALEGAGALCVQLHSEVDAACVELREWQRSLAA